jgi:hypothetical protein
MTIDWKKYEPYFTEAEFRCKETAEIDMDPHFMNALLALRLEYGKPMRVTSGFRSVKHSVEKGKAAPGWHTRGCAADIACDFFSCRELVGLAAKHGFTFGISQKNGAPRFLHLDLRPGKPGIYSY